MLLIAILKYTKPLSEVDKLLPPHRKYLEQLLQEGKLLIAGRIHPRTGGVIIVKNLSRSEFESILQNDPLSEVCEFQITEFSPTFHDPTLSI